MIDKKNEKKSSTRIPLKFDCTQIEHVYLEFSVYQQYTSPRDLFVCTARNIYVPWIRKGTGNDKLTSTDCFITKNKKSNKLTKI